MLGSKRSRGSERLVGQACVAEDSLWVLEAPLLENGISSGSPHTIMIVIRRDWSLYKLCLRLHSEFDLI